MKIFSGSSNIPLAEHIAKELYITVSPIETHIFPDGERRIRIAERVVDEDCIVVQSASSPVDAHYMELFFIVDGLKRSGAKSVTAVVPYFGYQRQDHVFRDGEAVSLEVIINILERLGIDKLVSIDMHSVRIPDLFTIPVNHVSALPLFAEKIQELLKINVLDISSRKDPNQMVRHMQNEKKIQETVLISPDMGGIARIKKISELLNNMPYAALEKNRDLVSGSIAGDAVREGSVEGKKIAFLVDDMISSGKTIALAAEVLQKLGLEELYVFATHAVFSEKAPTYLQKTPVKKVFVTDTVLIPEEKKFEKLEILSVRDIIAEELK